MNLFIDTLSEVNVLILFDNNKQIIKKYDFDVKMNESTKLIPEIDNFLKSNVLTYNDLDNIVVVNWPWSFTWIRTLVILVNTINFVIKKSITPITFFDLYDNYPIFKRSSKKDSFLKLSKNSEIEIILNDELEYKLLKDNLLNLNWCSDFANFNVNKSPNYQKVLDKLVLQDNKLIEPFYLKKPNIF